MKRNTSRQSGFTLVEIMIVVAIIGLLAAIAIPNFVKARETSQSNACINNLRQVDGAKQQWALETKQASAAAPAYTDISVYLKNSVTCPSGGSTATFATSYTIGDMNTKPVCQIGGAFATNPHMLPADTAN
jgi:prepilin-type N-terminal cleavage/methylation domain-containing protein